MHNQDQPHSFSQDNHASNDDGENATRQQWKEMRDEKLKDQFDVSLESPQDANTGKHINFLEAEQTGTTDDDRSNREEETPVQRQWREMREEKIDNNQDISLQSPQDANTIKHINFREDDQSGTNDGEEEYK